MYILVINSGSSSVKYELFRLPHAEVLAKGIVERIGQKGAFHFYYPANREPIKVKKQVSNHTAAIKLTINTLTHPNYGVINNMSQIKAVGHRVVHGGEKFSNSVLITDKVIKTIKKCFELAPLHNPPNLLGIMACRRHLPGVIQTAVFDTAFYQSMPMYSYIYGLPYELYEKLGIRRYGFHGTSHKYVASRTAEILEKSLKKLKVVTCHLGNGCSITAVKYGMATDTSMGFTPLEGLLMGTRCGDIDPAIVFYLMEKKKLTTEGVNELLNKKSGLLGVSGISNDMRDVYKAALKGNQEARLAFDIFVHRIQKYIGAYASVMNGLDAVVFTAGIGENHVPTRRAVCKNLEYLGIKINPKKNRSNQKEKIITDKSSKVKVLVVPTNEEMMIAKDTFRLFNKSKLHKKL